MIGMIWLADAPMFQPWRDQFVAQFVGLRPSRRSAALRLALDDVERGDGGGGGGGRAGGGEDVRPGAIHEPVDQRAAAGDEAADAAEGLAERADADVDAVFHAQVFGHAAAVRAEDAGGVGFVDHQHGVVPFGQFGQVRPAGRGRRPC